MGEGKLSDPPDRLLPQSQPMFTVDKNKKLTIVTIGPKYLIMSRVSKNNTIKKTSSSDLSKEKNETLTNVSPFLIKKVIDGICGSEVEMCKKIRDGNILIKTKNHIQASKLITLTSLSPTIPVEVREHTNLNFSKGVIYCNDLRGMDEKEILDELKYQNVTEVKKILKKAGNDLIETGLLIITIATLNLPDHLNVGYEKVKLRPYIPFPLRCRKCLRFGHTTNSCSNNKVCPNCALDFHFEEDDDTCSNPITCVNCINDNNENSKHNALDKICPVFIKEKEIQAIVSLEKVDRRKAVETYKLRHQNSPQSFSSVLKSSSSVNIISSPVNTPNTFSNTREVMKYSDNETPTCSKLVTKELSPKKQTVSILPINTSNRNKQAMKRKNNKKLGNKNKQTKHIINIEDIESAESMSQDNE